MLFGAVLELLERCDVIGHDMLAPLPCLRVPNAINALSHDLPSYLNVCSAVPQPDIFPATVPQPAFLLFLTTCLSFNLLS